ncbi:hypothetical protein [Sphingomonas pokkalii]|nr:hypothetical protein [Sphingomonas pokkalii]
MRISYPRNAGRPWAVRILLSGPQPGAARRAQAMPFEQVPAQGAAPTRV